MTSSNLKAKTDVEKVALLATQGIVGKRCWRATFGCSGELHLHCGAHIPYRNRKLADKTKGAWRFGTAGTDWKLLTPKGGVSSKRQSEKVLTEHIELLAQGVVSGFRLRGNVLAITFDNGCQLQVIPAPDDDKYDLPYWELFMPRRKLVTFGPKGRWSFGPAGNE